MNAHNLWPYKQLDELRVERDKWKARAEAAERARDENYTDLLDQMAESWGPVSASGDLTREEVQAFLSSRIVHKPATILRAQLAVAREALEDIVTVTEETQTVHMQHCACNYRCLDLAREALARLEARP